MIPITKPFLPPIEEYTSYLEGIWKRNWLTNSGPLVNELELKLKQQLGVKHLLFVSNGTIALMLAIKALELEGEIITTPFSFVATTSSIAWQHCKPVFVDVDSQTLNIDPDKIEAAITENTSAILATHVYGNPCEVEKIQKIADKHHLKVIYDGAHCFGVKLKGRSVFEFGDISICSLHATKLYHSVEGGLIVTKDPDLLKKMAYMCNFGFDGPVSFRELGINGKNSEMHAAMGLANLKYIDEIHQKRKELSEFYDEMLKNVKGFVPKWNANATKNYAYYPIVFETEELTLKVIKRLNGKEIYPRRYFYPSLAKSLPYVPYQAMKITENVSPRILCLPLYYDLSIEEVRLTARIILRTQNN